MKNFFLLINIFFFILLFSCKSTKKTNDIDRDISVNEIVSFDYERPDNTIDGIFYKNNNYIDIADVIYEKRNHESFDRESYERETDTEYLFDDDVPVSYTPNVDVSYGDIHYIINDTMVVGEINKINLTISESVKESIIINEIETFNNYNTYSDSIRITPTMVCRLVDPGDNFKITPITEEEQLIEKNSYTKWQWDVIPNNKGDHKLILTVDIIIEDNKKNIEVYENLIYVYSKEKLLDKIIKFFNENWKWILSTLILPFLLIGYKKYKNYDKEI